MNQEPEVAEIGLNGLDYRCRQESAQFFSRKEFDPRYCFELFRRAFAGRDEQALACLYHNYRTLVLSWVARHPLAGALDEEAEYFLNRAYEKMWAVITPEKFAGFRDLKSLLRYLQMCLHSVMIDHARAREQAKVLEEDEEGEERSELTDRPDEAESLEQRVARRQEARALWALVEQRLKSEQERVVAYGMFVVGLKPRELIEEFPGLFRGVNEIYILKENLLARLRRDRALLDALEGRAEEATHGGGLGPTSAGKIGFALVYPGGEEQRI
jgi:DNA-directed RNA polymerase specialized sigma24 family protein